MHNFIAVPFFVPNKGEQIVRYYGYFSNVSRGLRKKANTDEIIPAILELRLTSKAFRQDWTRLIQKIYQTDPLTCPRLNGLMHVIACVDSQAKR
jgi:hypothetical protein